MCQPERGGGAGGGEGGVGGQIPKHIVQLKKLYTAKRGKEISCKLMNENSLISKHLQARKKFGLKRITKCSSNPAGVRWIKLMIQSA